MGILYSHIVFQPPVPPTYGDDDGSFTFRRMRSAQPDSDDDDDNDHNEHATTTDVSNDGSNLGADYVQHPVFYLQTERHNTIAAAYFHQPRSHFTILFSHGNGEDLGVTASYALQLSNTLKTSVLCYDYSGYGISTGKSSEGNCYADIRAAYSYLLTQRRVAPERIVLFGRSLGSGPTVELAASLGARLGGVVLIAPLLSCVRVVFNSVPSTPKFDMFANVDKIARVQVPVFCVHGMVDNVVPFYHGLQLTKRARFPLEPLWMRDASHNNLESSRFQYEVFLRYLTVLQEFRRWRAPRVDAPPQHERVACRPSRRHSASALGKVAGCFGPRSAPQPPPPPQQSQSQSQSQSQQPQQPQQPQRRARSRGRVRSGARRKTAAGAKRASSSYTRLPMMLMASRSVKLLHEEELRALWSACDDAGGSNNKNKMTKRASDSELMGGGGGVGGGVGVGGGGGGGGSGGAGGSARRRHSEY